MEKKSINFHLIFFIVILALFLFAIVKLWLWNKGEASGYDPNEDTSEFDVETMDYIQPLSSSRLEGHEDDGVTTLLCLGNSPFADNKGEGGLAQALAREVDGVAYDASFAGSFQSLKNEAYQADYPADGVSLYSLVKAFCSGDYTSLEQAAGALGSDAEDTVKLLKGLDFSTIDMIVIMYDLSDYIDHRPLYDPNNDSNLVTWSGSLNASLKLLDETYPHIRTVILSTPACGKTIDEFYVDGDIQNLGNGTIPDYLNYQMNVILSNGVSYIDNYYGVITVDNRDEYLVDDYHLNEKGIQAIASRFGHFFGNTSTEE
ncbi:MAG: hypothetical protein SOX11_05635 [Lachnospiraceae bacterium]|nr:hypothetical protein [Lachnospiraceae bacterium]MDY3222604.1 hypothetical protein [Lachnospiraceae bacterium]